MADEPVVESADVLPSCSACRFARTNQGTLECHRNAPPSCSEALGEPGAGFATWPSVDDADWCGEYESSRTTWLLFAGTHYYPAAGGQDLRVVIRNATAAEAKTAAFTYAHTAADDDDDGNGWDWVSVIRLDTLAEMVYRRLTPDDGWTFRSNNHVEVSDAAL